MPADSVQTVQQLVLTGPLPLRHLIAVAAVLLLVMTLLVWREVRAVRPWLVLVVLPLRLVAVAVVVIMLAEPALEQRTRHSRAKVLTVLADASASMDSVDELLDVPTPEALRWAAARKPDLLRPLAAADRLAAALGQLERSYERFMDVLPRLTADDSRREANHVIQLADSCSRDLEELAGSAPGAACNQIRTAVADVRAATVSLRDQVDAGRLLIDAGRLEELKTSHRAAAQAHKTALAIADGIAAVTPDGDTLGQIRAASRASRRQQTAELLRQACRQLPSESSNSFRMLRYRFDTAVQPIAANDWMELFVDSEGAQATDLAAALQQASREAATQSVAAVVLLSDGGHNAAGDPVKTAEAGAGPPLFIVPIGNTRLPRDVLLHHVQAPRTALHRDRVVIEALVSAQQCGGEKVTVELRRGEETLDSQPVTFNSDDETARISFTYQAESVGAQELELRVSRLPDERVRDNNAATVRLEVMEDTIRVLLADDLPRWEFRYLRNLFKRDKHVQYDALLFGRAAGGEPSAEDRRLWPRSLDDWNRYRVVILGDMQATELSIEQQDLLEQYVKRGGTLVLIAGENAMPGAYIGQPIAPLLPVELAETPPATTGYTPAITAEGAATAPIQLETDPLSTERRWRGLDIHKLSDFCKPRPGAHVLIACIPREGPAHAPGSEPALLSWQYYGRGRVVYLAAPVTYRLRERYGDRYHHRFWGQLLRWAIARDLLAGSRTVRIGTDRGQYPLGSPVSVWVQLSQPDGQPVAAAKPAVVARQDEKEIASSDLTEDPERPGHYKAVFEGLPSGPVTIQPRGDAVSRLLAEEGYTETVQTVARIEPAVSPELRDTRCRLPLLRKLTEVTRGQILPPTALAATLARLELSPEVWETAEQRPVWPRWSLLLLFVGCLSAEWTIRKLAGLA